MRVEEGGGCTGLQMLLRGSRDEIGGQGRRKFEGGKAGGEGAVRQDGEGVQGREIQAENKKENANGLPTPTSCRSTYMPS